MERIKELNRYQRGILVVLVAMIVVFGVIYAFVSSQVGFLYFDEILICSQSNGNTRYSGTVNDRECCFTVTADKTVTFQCDDKTYGPYTAKEDPTAVPAGKEYLTGVEVLEGDTVFFRGGIYKDGDDLMLYNEDGGFVFDIVVTSDSGFSVDENGSIIDPLEPSAKTVLELMAGPELVSKGKWIAYFGGILLSVLTAVSILFADEMFRFHLAFRVWNAQIAEPSDLEIMRRYIGSTVLTVAAFAIYIIGLQ